MEIKNIKMIKENRYITRELRHRSKSKRKKPFHISLATVFPIPFSLQSNECILNKIHILSLLSVFLLLQISAQPLFQIHFKEMQT